MVDRLLKTNGLSVSGEGLLLDWLLKTNGLSVWKMTTACLFMSRVVFWTTKFVDAQKACILEKGTQLIVHIHKPCCNLEKETAHVYLQIMLH